MSATKDILILGVGNDCLGDDAVGPLVVRELRRRLKDGRPDGGPEDVDLVEAGGGGMILLDLMAGYRGLILIDAIQTAKGRPGRIHRLTEDQLPAGSSAIPWSAHHMGLRQILETGRRVGSDLPGTVIVYGVETEVPQDWGQGCSPEVERAVPEVVRRVRQEMSSLRAETRLEKGSR
jgi:hydrogenase maturation protease